MLLSLRQSNSTDTNMSYEVSFTVLISHIYLFNSSFLTQGSISPDESESENLSESLPQSVQVSPQSASTPPQVFVFPDQPLRRMDGVIEMNDFNLASRETLLTPFTASHLTNLFHTDSEDSTWSMSSQTKRMRTDPTFSTSLPCSYDGSVDSSGLEVRSVLVRFGCFYSTFCALSGVYGSLQ